MTVHVCHAHGCNVRTLPRMFLCRPHWYALRKPVRDAIWREFREGQEKDKKPSARYLAVAQRAIGELVFKPHDEEAAAFAAPYLLRSEEFRKMAIDRGEGDPLVGLTTVAPS